MGRKNGFTLVELMGVLIIIGVLTLIIVPVATNIIKNQKEENYEQQVTNVVLASKNFGSDNLMILPPTEGDYMFITVGQLKLLGYLEKDIINPLNNEQISDCTKIKITKLKNYYNYEYEYDTEKNTECAASNGNVEISGDFNKYIKKGDVATYTVTINKAENEYSSYQIDKSKITLTSDNSTDSTYTIQEGNGIYKVIVTAGSKEGEVGLKLESGAIIKNSSQDLIGSNGLESSKKFIIDNTVPQIVFGTNGNNKWSKTASSTIDVTDALSGGNSSTYKCTYSTNQNETPNSNIFASGSSCSLSYVTGNYYLIASACDNAGNCTTSKTNIFKLDNTAPSAPTVALADGNWNGKNDDTWYNHDIYVVGNVNGKSDNSKAIPTSTDANSGVLKYEISNDGTNWVTWNYDSSNSMYYYKETGETKRYVRAIDNAGNVSEITEKIIKVDKVKPTAPKVNLVQATTKYDDSGQLIYTYGDTAIEGEWYTGGVTEFAIVLMGTSEDNKPTSEDQHSGILKYQVSIGAEGYAYDYTDVWTDWDWTLDSDESVYDISKNWYYRTTTTSNGIKNFYVRAIDNAGNISDETVKVSKIDIRKPEITSISVGSCSNGKRKITLKGYDDESGITGYAITSNSTTPAVSAFNVTSVTTWTSGYYSPGTYYAWVKDGVDKISPYIEETDWTGTDVVTKFDVSSCSTTSTSDTTAPTISFGTNGSSSYVASASTKVTVTDSSGVKSVKFGWSTSSTSTTAGSTTTSGSTLSSKCGRETDGSCYLYVYACDNNNNCTGARTSAFKLDVTAPSITNMTRSSCKTGLKMGYNVYDGGSGVVKYGDIFCDININNNNHCYNSVDNRYKTVTATNNVIKRSTTWTSCDTNPPVKGQGYASWAKAVDKVGNIGYGSLKTNILPFSGTACNSSCG